MKRHASAPPIVLGIILLLLLAACDGQLPPTTVPGPSPTTVPITTRPVSASPTATLAVPGTATAPVPTRQATIANTEAEYVYVTTPGSAAVSVIDGPGHQVVATITGDGLPSPTGIAVGPDGLIYVANFYSPTLAVIDPRKNMVTSTIALSRDELVGVAASSRMIYVTSNDWDILFVTPGQNVVVEYIPSPGASPSTVVADEQRIYVAYVGVGLEQEGSHIAVLDARSGQPILDIRVSGLEPDGTYLRGGGNIRGLSLTAPGQLYCIIDIAAAFDGEGNRLLVIDTATGAVIQEWKIPLRPDYYAFMLDAQLAVAPNGKVYIANTGADTVLVFDPRAGKVVRTIPVGDQPSSIAIGTTNRAYVTNQGDDTVSVIDVMTDEVIGEPIPVGQEPLGLAIYHP